jgi:hypothetical protein
VFQDFNMFAKTDSRRTKLVTIGLLTMVLASAAHGQIYRTVDENGNVVFTDIPPREGDTAEQVIVEQPNSFAVEEAIGPREQWIVEPEATPAPGCNRATGCAWSWTASRLRKAGNPSSRWRTWTGAPMFWHWKSSTTKAEP